MWINALEKWFLVAERENFVLFEDVLKDSNSQKIAGENNSRKVD